MAKRGERPRPGAAGPAAGAWKVLALALTLAAVWCLGGFRLAEARAAGAFPATLVDVAGRSVTVPAEPRRVVLGEGLQFLALSLVHEDPAGILALWGDDLKAYDASTYRSLAAAFPRLAEVPVIGSKSGGLSLEAVLSAEPDLVILSLWQKSATAALVSQMEAADVPVVFIDFYEAPLENTGPSMLALGAALGRAQKAEAFDALYRDALAEVSEALAAAKPGRPKTFLQSFAGVWPCCWSAGSGGLGTFLDLAGADNLGATRFPSPGGGNVNVEFLLSEDPALYITTGLSDSGATGGLLIGTGVAPEAARESLERLAALPGVSKIDAVRTGRVHGVWNYFNGSPLNILAIQAFAGFAHPEIADRIDPQKTLDRLNADFLAAPLAGTFWTSLKAPGDSRTGEK